MGSQLSNEVFDMVDTDNSGHIDVTEAKDLLKVLPPHLKTPLADLVDVCGSKKIKKKEFAKFFKSKKVANKGDLLGEVKQALVAAEKAKLEADKKQGYAAMAARKLSHPIFVLDPATAKLKTVHWHEFDLALPLDDDERSRKVLISQFKKGDTNGNGYVSLAEMEALLKSVLHFGEPIRRALAKSIARSFRACRETTGKHKDYVEKTEFPLFVEFLRYDLFCLQMFQEMDKSSDSRVSDKEFSSMVPRLARKYSMPIPQDLAAEFKEMDRDGHGMVLYDEFADYMLSHRIANPSPAILALRKGAQIKEPEDESYDAVKARRQQEQGGPAADGKGLGSAGPRGGAGSRPGTETGSDRQSAIIADLTQKVSSLSQKVSALEEEKKTLAKRLQSSDQRVGDSAFQITTFLTAAESRGIDELTAETLEELLRDECNLGNPPRAEYVRGFFRFATDPSPLAFAAEYKRMMTMQAMLSMREARAGTMDTKALLRHFRVGSVEDANSLVRDIMAGAAAAGQEEGQPMDDDDDDGEGGQTVTPLDVLKWYSATFTPLGESKKSGRRSDSKLSDTKFEVVQE